MIESAVAEAPVKRLMYERLFTPTSVTLVEDKGAKRMRVEGILSVAGEITGNGRRYNMPIWQKHVGDSQSAFMKRVHEHKVLGMLEHPEADPHLDKVSHLIEDVKLLPNGEVHGKMTILETPMGKILRELFEVGVPVGCSSRGEGSTVTAEDGVTEDVQEDYDLETWDFVHTPALDRARARPVKESQEKVRKESEMKSAIEQARATLGEAEKKTLSALEVPELASLHMQLVEAMTPLAAATESEAAELRGRLAGLGAQVSKALSEKAKTPGQKVAEQFNAQYPDAMSGVSALVEKLVAQNEQLTKQLKDAQGEDGSETHRRLEAAMRAGEDLVKRTQKLTQDNALLERKYSIAIKTLDKVMEAVRARGLKAQVEALVGKVPALRHVQDELLKSRTSAELEGKIKTFSKLIQEQREQAEEPEPAPAKTESKKPQADDHEPVPPTGIRKGIIHESQAGAVSKPQSFFGRLKARGL